MPIRYRFYIVAAVIIAIGIQMALWCSGCASIPIQKQYAIATAISAAVKKITPTLLAAYELEQQAATDDSDTEIEAASRVAVIRDKWDPVWDAHDAFVSEYNVYLRQLEQGIPPSSYQMYLSFCRLKQVLPERFHLDSTVHCE